MGKIAITIMLVLSACASEEGDDAECSPAADTCTGENVCVASSCVPAFPRVYSVGSIQHVVPTLNQGAAWDPGTTGMAPDLYVAIVLNGAVVTTTPVVNDSYSANWPGPFPVSLIAGSNLTLNSYDEDTTMADPLPDPGYGCVSNPITAAHVRARAIGCTADWTMSFRIEPR